MQVIAVPVKRLDRAKRRLAPLLSEPERAALTIAMLEDVLDAAVAQEGWEVWVVSSAHPVLDVAARHGARAVRERGSSLRAAVRQAEQDVAVASGDAALAVLLADLPLITSGALSEALARPGPVVAAAAVSDGGTNLLVRRPGSAVPARFGPASFARHREEALRAGLAFHPVRSEALGFDLDRPTDLLRVAGGGTPGRTGALCRELGLEARLRVPASG